VKGIKRLMRCKNAIDFRRINKMDEFTAAIIVAGLPFYTMSVVAVAYCMAYLGHMLRRVDQSASETGLTETVPSAPVK
jgi:hypothetical protein